jgi:hypothetical protein
MQFKTLNNYQIESLAIPAIEYFKATYGSVNSLKVEEELHQLVSWRPTFYFKKTKFNFIACEVSETLLPQLLDSAAADLINNAVNIPTSVYVICPHSAYAAAKNGDLEKVRSRGYGVITVDEHKHARTQIDCIPLIHHISRGVLEQYVRSMKGQIKVAVADAYTTYCTNAEQGVQQSAQIIENLITLMAEKCVVNNMLTRVETSAAKNIDALYSCATQKITDYRAVWGDARSFMKFSRNAFSHAPTTQAEAAERMKNCKKGFLDSLDLINKLTSAITGCGFKVKLH